MKPRQKQKMSRRTRLQALYGMLYILPSFLIIMTFCVITIFMTIYFSLTDYNMYSPPQFSALKNYVAIFQNKTFYAALANTGKYVLATAPAQVLLSLGIAAFLADRLRNTYGALVRSAMFIPQIVSAVAAASVWKVIFKPNGILNSGIELLGGEGVNWLGDKQLAFLSVAIVSVWKSVGYFLVIYYAGIMGVSPELYDAAVVDGASAWQRFRHITIPSVKPITYMVVTLSIIWSFQTFDIIYQMTAGGPGTSTITLAYVIYQQAFSNHKMGSASAYAVILLVIVLLIHMVQDLFFKERKGGRAS